MTDAPEEPRCDAVPVLPVADLIRAVAFYERLGFDVRSLYADDGYAILGYDDTEIHLAENPDIAGTLSFSGVYLRVPDADVVHARWMAMGADEVAPLTDQPYGIREFATQDLEGNLWRVGANIGGAGPGRHVPAADDFDALLAEHAVFDDPPSAPTEAPSPPLEGVDHEASGPDGSAEPDGSERPHEPVAATTAGHRDVASDADRPTDGSPGTPDDQWLVIVSSGGRCAGCGLVSSELPARALGAEVRDEAHSLAELLRAAPDDLVRYRPAPGTWSVLEYGVHVRDVLSVFADRIVRTLRQHEPELTWWDEQEAMADGMANESDLDAVADDLGRNAAKLSEALRLVGDDDWTRPAICGPHRFTIELLARTTLHEVVHHRTDARRALDAT